MHCLDTVQCQNFRTIYGGQEPNRNRVAIAARQATQAGGIDSLESIPELLKSLKLPFLLYWNVLTKGFAST